MSDLTTDMTADDWQGIYSESIKIKRAGAETKYSVDWYQVRCSECNGRFRMLEGAEGNA